MKRKINDWTQMTTEQRNTIAMMVQTLSDPAMVSFRPTIAIN